MTRFLAKFGRVVDAFDVFSLFSVDRTRLARRSVSLVDAALSNDDEGGFVRSDAEAIRSDFQTTGQDIRVAFDEYGKNIRRN